MKRLSLSWTRRALSAAGVCILGFLLWFVLTTNFFGGSAPSSPLAKPGWALAFHDEFNGNSLDRSKWNDSYWYGRTHDQHGEGELEYYAPDADNVQNGSLRLVAEKRTMGGHLYTSGMVTTFGKFSQKYGWYEIRAKLPAGRGFWPAFWLLPESRRSPPEIDILETTGTDCHRNHMTVHWRNTEGERQHEGWFSIGPNLTAGYHVFAIDWEPNSITWYVDGAAKYQAVSHIPDEPMYLIANLAVGGRWPKSPDETTPFPASLEIDYIRVYQKNARDLEHNGSTSR